MMTTPWRALPRLFALAALLALPPTRAFAFALDEELDARSALNPVTSAAQPPAEPAPDAASETPPGDLAARVAEAFVGTPYAFGQKSSKAIDCSGLMQLSYDAAGVPLPRTAAEQSTAGTATTIETAAPGDLLFYRFRRNSQQLHVAMYVGSGRAVHASIKHGVVRLVNVLTGPWPQHLVKIVRPAAGSSPLRAGRVAG